MLEMRRDNNYNSNHVKLCALSHGNNGMYTVMQSIILQRLNES